jgi:formylglycine-generating enzyme required for sulfatase activity
MSTSLKPIFLLMILIGSHYVKANNIRLSNAILTAQNVTNDFVLIKFDVAWDNSWRVNTASTNWDAAWVYAKFRKKSSLQWRHCSLNWVDGTGANDGHTVPSGATINSSQDATGKANGVFIYSNTNISGGTNVSYNNVRLRWNYGMDGVDDQDSVEISVFGVEMVFVPEGAFELGGPVPSGSNFSKGGSTTEPIKITSDSALTIGTSAGNLQINIPGTLCTFVSGTTQWGSAPNSGTTIPASFPKGFKGFYCMKYELSQDHYVAFLNHLDPVHASARRPAAAGRNAITVSSGIHSTSRGAIPVAGIDAEDMLAFLDWAALRPMTEMEYEKACRGPEPAVPNEMAWGNGLPMSGVYTLSNANLSTENISAGYGTGTAGNVCWNSTRGSNLFYRGGIFAANSANTGRVSSGGTYYGIMEMSGNLNEIVVTVNTANGRAFEGVHGDGSLNSSGTYDVSNWGLESDYRTRGGNYLTGSQPYYSGGELEISGRGANTTYTGTCCWSCGSNFALTFTQSRSGTHGIRGVRSAP